MRASVIFFLKKSENEFPFPAITKCQNPLNCYFFYFIYSTLNPVLYNVMSHRYRLAFRDTLCSKRRGYYSSANGFSRDQSSFRETTIVAAGRDHNLNYEGSQLVSIEQWFLLPLPHFPFYSYGVNRCCHHRNDTRAARIMEDWIVAYDGRRTITLNGSIPSRWVKLLMKILFLNFIIFSLLFFFCLILHF